MSDRATQGPITLFVESINIIPTLEHTERVTFVDLEMTEKMAREIVAGIKMRLDETPVGAIRVRFAGRLVLG